MFPGQNSVPRMPQGSHLENKMLTPPGNQNMRWIDGSSRMRNFINMDPPAPISESTYGYSGPYGSNLNKGSYSGAPIENQAYALNSIQRKTTGLSDYMHQPEGQFHSRNSYPGPFDTSNMNFMPIGHDNLRAPLPSPPQVGPLMPTNMNFIKSANNNLGKALLPAPPRSLAPGESFASAYGQSAEDVARLTWQQQACDRIGTSQNNQLLNSGGVNEISNQKYSFPGKESQFGRIASFGVSSGEISENVGQETGNGSVRKLENKVESNTKNLNNTLPGVSSVSSYNIKSVEASQKNHPMCTLLNSNKKDKLDDKAASTVAEKLWEGSLKLSSTVTVPSVAYFKSGEKLLNTNWFNSVEVKGKVKVEAFEKYLQSLPCSHNKGLMVISLCLKEGSSHSSLKRMMEVARGYNNRKRVGFAHLSREVHLYICPQSEAIITILAKYGFYKDMAATKETQNSMIGCIIWRKDRTSNSVAKNPLRKCQAPALSSEDDSDSDFEDSSLMQLVQEIVAPLSATSTSTFQDDKENGGISSQSSPIEIKIEVGDTLISTQRPEDPRLHHVAPRDLTMVNDQPVKRLRTEQPQGNSNFPNLIIPLLEMPSDNDIDDLPEYDFMAAGNPSLSSLRKLSEGETMGSRSQIAAFNPSEKGAGGQIPNASSSTTILSFRKTLFDDDDMPEWCPPERPDVMPPVSHFQNSSHCPPFSSQSFGAVCHSGALQMRPSRCHPSSENGSSSILRPPPSFPAKLPFDRAE